MLLIHEYSLCHEEREGIESDIDTWCGQIDIGGRQVLAYRDVIIGVGCHLPVQILIIKYIFPVVDPETCKHDVLDILQRLQTIKLPDTCPGTAVRQWQQ